MENELFNKYKAEIEEELDLSDFNIKDVQMRMPSVKHKWVARLIEVKIELNKLKNLKKEAIKVVAEQNRTTNVAIMSEQALARQAESHDTVKKILTKIDECDLLIEYLEGVVRVCNSTTYDIKNLVDIKKLELT